MLWKFNINGQITTKSWWGDERFEAAGRKQAETLRFERESKMWKTFLA